MVIFHKLSRMVIFYKPFYDYILQTFFIIFYKLFIMVIFYKLFLWLYFTSWNIGIKNKSGGALFGNGRVNWCSSTFQIVIVFVFVPVLVFVLVFVFLLKLKTMKSDLVWECPSELMRTHFRLELNTWYLE